jgi:Holliday junction resolvasome RuvABC DNA-binding subunit
MAQNQNHNTNDVQDDEDDEMNVNVSPPVGVSTSTSSLSHQINPTEENITALMNMGFTRQQAIAALIQARNNLQIAINLLIDGN